MNGEPIDNIRHEPVMVEEVLSFILERARHLVVDCTVGDGGHSWEILGSSSGTYVLGIDVDDEAVAVSDKRLISGFKGRFKVVKWDYRELPEALARFGVPRISGLSWTWECRQGRLTRPREGFHTGQKPRWICG